MNVTIPTRLSEIFTSAMMLKEGDLVSYQNGEEFVNVCQMSFSHVSEIYEFLDVPDSLTDYVYGNPGEDGKYSFPVPETYSDRVKPVLPYRGSIGEQSNLWHTENLKEHAAIVACNLVAAGVKPEMASMLGVLHDCGKKYSAETNSNRDVYFPEHETLGAYLTICWTHDWALTEDEKRLLAAIVYGHMKYHDWHDGTAKATKSERDYIKEVTKVFSEDIALKAYGLVNLLGASNEGVKRGAKKNPEKIAKGEEIIRN